MENKNSIHAILSRSYLVFLLIFSPLIFIDIFWPVPIFDKNMQILGAFLMVLSPLILISAQKASKSFKQAKKIYPITAESFKKGLYKITRTPTHIGLLFLAMGFAISANLPFLLVGAMTSFIITRHTFITKEERVLAEKYGAPYIEYKKTTGRYL